ncbi:MAG: hypothetical protein HQL05_15200 [Nitrospirae bacterium]|uniref:hypothetical protein n=1 Tax=Candidatus Magnetobacterium casense TaxID=1455061 RepID=UPI00058D909B|nr:hypothetical protein [Candidatus Magnetobacterium casensis]MBF0339165.1 hypothetical protein [Nitrospirota bacterium]
MIGLFSKKNEPAGEITMKKLFEAKGKGKAVEKKEDTKNDIAILENTANVIFKKLEKQIEILEAIEASVDAKLVNFERLLHMADSVNHPQGAVNRQHEVMALTYRGLDMDEIADVLGMQRGEVELILNLNK